ncbi:acyl-CoA synthetase [Rhodococcus qingshengii]|uniref:acyl-CoA synthetase n=1 Tax=Rhodococcus qingshengii TaxID=334542 RepID=UPI001BEADE44|nr:long-chain fatty acid--CoA ligase [Rhodococcus qingshengii]MBT2275897.1 long-chain fatty acid--CoA ligase [Rhodococcus qingshengii]
MFLTQGLHRAVQQNPSRVATIFGARHRTYAEQYDRVARLAGGLQAVGVAMGDRVAMLSLNSDYYCEYFLGVPWAGGVLNPVNIRWSESEIAYSLNDSGTSVLLVDDAFLAAVPGLTFLCPQITTVIHCGQRETPPGLVNVEELIHTSAPVDDAYRHGDDLAGVFYTGGTTGFPKGVMLSHTNLITSALGALSTGFSVTAGGRVLHSAPMFHSADFAGWVQQSLMGGTQVMVPRFDPVDVLEAVSRDRITDMVLVPTMIQIIADHPDVLDYDVSSLKTVLYGGSPIPAAVLSRAADVFPGVRFTQVYGMTELSTVATLLAPDDHRSDGPRPERLRSAGKAAPHCDIRILDANGRAVPTGVVGEIVVRGAHTTSGYWNKPEETAEALRHGWMHTGDVGHFDEDGYLFVDDRIKDMIVTGGENVYSVEVEAAIAQHPSIANVAVIGVPDRRWGERVHAVVVLRQGCELTAADVSNHAKSLIAGYKAPRSVDFVDALPMTGTGKVLKRRIKSDFEAERASP